MKVFNSDAHVEEWMAENGGIEGLRRALARGAFAGQNKSLASAWLQLHDRRQEEQAAQAERSLLERSVLAAEESAKSAQHAVRWAMWAAVIALLAIVVTVVRRP
jgi:aryl-alcohol dehydrogenase-like predicted oxidoreductase